MNAILAYTAKSPCAPGYYWLRVEGNEDIVEVWNDPGHPAREKTFFIHRCGSGECAEIASLKDAQWAGPIPPPQPNSPPIYAPGKLP
jgi:hypothetical protein